MFGLTGFAKGIAKTQLRSYQLIRQHNPQLNPLEAYIDMMMLRPGYDEDRTARVLKVANDTADRAGRYLNLRMVVMFMVVDEHVQNTHRKIDRKQLDKIQDVIASIIPQNI